MGNGTPLNRQSGPPFKLHLKHHLSPGDVLVMTAAVESLHRTYPDKYKVSVDTTCREIWQNNPGVCDVPAHDCAVIQMHYPAVNECGQRHLHFMAAFCEYLSGAIGQPVPLRVNKPALYLSDDEKKNRLPGTEDIGNYVVVNAGRKDDFTAKWGGSHIWQEVVRRLGDRVRFVQVGEGHHHHPPLDGAVNLIGKTSARDLFRLVHHSVAAAGPVSFLLHVSAALGRPYVALAGGREEQSWEAYNTTIYLHAVGQLDCCKEKACWRSRTVRLGDGGNNDHSLCKLPVVQPDGEYVPRCLQMIGADGVIRALEQIVAGIDRSV